MTNERDKKDSDALVSETYRDLHAPRAPDHLNQTILRMAASKNPGKRDFLFAAWIKPVTLAATIALSLAIVMELTEVPATAVQLDIAPAVEQQVESVSENEATSADERLVEELTLNDADLAKSEAKSKMDSFVASPSAAAVPAARKRPTDMPASNQAAAMSLESDQAVAERLIATEPAASMEITSAKKESIAAATCDEKARQSADTWLDCIQKLSESGFALDADREYKAFILEYPAEAANSKPNK